VTFQSPSCWRSSRKCSDRSIEFTVRRRVFKALFRSGESDPIVRAGCRGAEALIGSGAVASSGLQRQSALRHGGNTRKSLGVGPAASGAVWRGLNRRFALPRDLTRLSRCFAGAA
jgi:hypothetical protein